MSLVRSLAAAVSAIPGCLLLALWIAVPFLLVNRVSTYWVIASAIAMVVPFVITLHSTLLVAYRVRNGEFPTPGVSDRVARP